MEKDKEITEVCMGMDSLMGVAKVHSIPLMSCVRIDEKKMHVIALGKPCDYVRMFGALASGSKELGKAMRKAVEMIDGGDMETETLNAYGQRYVETAVAEAYVDKIDHGETDSDLEKYADEVERLATDIRHVNGRENPVVMLTRVDGCIQAMVAGSTEEVGALLCEAMVRSEGFRRLTGASAEAANEFVREHPEGMED